ncbi:unnamed protein product [Gongylonema pulchrum]|uniref:HMG_CoA_synt_C domain-containing protein n=1 Tax=Gongylonema pulchrum TaxID=637853 RepID=A0A183ELD6_9BILA|nr:unnamed protein product [Gongylonema pulchrum]
MFSARISLNENESDAVHQFELMAKSANRAAASLELRLCTTPKRYNEILALREKLLSSQVPYKPQAARSILEDEFSLFPGTFYLDIIDEKYRRYYLQA